MSTHVHPKPVLQSSFQLSAINHTNPILKQEGSVKTEPQSQTHPSCVLYPAYVGAPTPVVASVEMPSRFHSWYTDHLHLLLPNGC